MKEKVKELFGPDPYFVELVLRHIEEYYIFFPGMPKEDFENLTMIDLVRIASDKEIKNEFLKCLSQKTFDLKGAIEFNGVNAKWIAEHREGAETDPIRIYASFVPIKERMEKRRYQFDPNRVSIQKVYGTPRSMGMNNLRKENTPEKKEEEQKQMMDEIKSIKEMETKKNSEEVKEKVKKIEEDPAFKEEIIKMIVEQDFRNWGREKVESFLTSKPGEEDYSSLSDDEIREKMVESYKKMPPYMGYCHSYWAIEKRLLKEKYDIDWYTPQEENPRALFD